MPSALVHSRVDVGSGMGSRQPNQPGSWQVAEAVGEGSVVMVGAGVAMLLVVVESWQPNQPGVLHEEVVELAEDVEVDFDVAGAVVVVGSLQPNQPGVLQVDVVVVVVLVLVAVVVVVVAVVDSSRQPHQPGVLHVDVLVRVGEAVVVVVVVVISEPLLLKNFHRTQS